jgi:hypothetical protein
VTWDTRLLVWLQNRLDEIRNVRTQSNATLNQLLDRNIASIERLIFKVQTIQEQQDVRKIWYAMIELCKDANPDTSCVSDCEALRRQNSEKCSELRRKMDPDYEKHTYTSAAQQPVECLLFVHKAPAASIGAAESSSSAAEEAAAAAAELSAQAAAKAAAKAAEAEAAAAKATSAAAGVDKGVAAAAKAAEELAAAQAQADVAEGAGEGELAATQAATQAAKVRAAKEKQAAAAEAEAEAEAAKAAANARAKNAAEAEAAAAAEAEAAAAAAAAAKAGGGGGGHDGEDEAVRATAAGAAVSAVMNNIPVGGKVTPEVLPSVQYIDY